MATTSDDEEYIAQLLEESAEADNPQITVEFIGEAWVGDYAREVDDGRTQYTVPLDALRTDDGEWAVHSTGTTYLVPDYLRKHENAPEWVQEWSGPHTIKLVGYQPPDAGWR